MRSGLLKDCEAVYIKQRRASRSRSGAASRTCKPTPVPKNLDWDMYCGPSPLKPFVRERFGGTHRCYWDYEGGGLSDMGQHFFDPVQWTFGKDDTSPVEIEAHAPPAHPEVTGMWGWVELKYADGLTFVLDSGEWGKPYDRKQARERAASTTCREDDRKKVEAMPDPEPLLTLRRGGQDAQAAGRQRRGGPPRRDAAAPGEHRHPRRPQDQVTTR